MDDFVSVFVDGACRNNGQEDPQGGCGVFWGDENPLNVSEYLVGEKQTNNRAELTAAIIALVQAKHSQMKQVQISTDSKYVKEGITKWILQWKANGWKTKQKSDVLNKDLWITLDKLSSQLQLKWCWVEGHGDVAGNLKADELAKSGISSESCHWQELVKSIEEERSSETKSTRESRRSDVQQGKETRKSDVISEKKYNCGTCKSPVADDGIQCGDCKLWFHYTCSKLPAYQLYMYEKSQRKYTCETCSNMDTEFNRKFDEMMAMSGSDEKCQEQSRGVKDHFEYPVVQPGKYLESETQTGVEHVDSCIQTDKPSDGKQMSDKCIQHESDSDGKTKKGKSATTDRETQTPESFTSIDKCLTDFQDVTVQRLESSFINAIDNFAKVHNNTTNLQNQIRKLTEERDSLKTPNQETSSKPDKKCDNCQTLSLKIENQDIENKKLKQQIFEVNLEKEMVAAKQQSALSVLNQKYESSKTQAGIIQQDVENMEKRLKIKCEVILELEEKVKKQNSDLLQLQDEVLAWKMHASRKDDSLVQQGSMKVQEQVQELPATESRAKVRSQKEESNVREKSSTPSEEPVIDIEAIPDKKSVLLIGTSNIKYIDANRLSSTEVEVQKTTKYTLKEGQEYINQMKENPDAVVLHLFENDMEKETPEDCAAKVHNICTDIKQKARNTKIVVSMGLPRREEGINRKVMKLNVLLQEKLADMESVSLCDNGNLFYRGQPSKGILNADGKHLSRLGTQKLSANLKSSIHKALGQSNGNGRYRPSNGFNGRRNGGSRRDRPRYGYYHGRYN